MLLPLNGRRIYYDLVGPETGPVLCVTHSLASDGGMWAEQMPPLLGAGYRVLRVDMRGHGGSDPVAGDYTMEELANDVATVLDALGVATAHYMGLSIGGMIGQAFAVHHGPRSIHDAAATPRRRRRPAPQETWAPRVEAVSDAKGLATDRRRHDGALVHRRLQGAASPGRWKQIRDTIVGTTAQGFLGCAAAIQNFDFLAELPTLKVPTLVVCGAEDQGTPPAGNKRIAELVPGGRYEEIANARHLPNVEHPDTFNRIMLGWLEARP